LNKSMIETGPTADIINPKYLESSENVDPNKCLLKTLLRFVYNTKYFYSRLIP